ncbi:hypothetical protein MMC11_005816 [Xylographa trunciseda]|nr:hypothetical protein [Xylographa trunciseda]
MAFKHADIAGLIGKTIKVLRELHNRWNTADITILNLIVQLTSLKAALNKISEWISSDLVDEPQHHQLLLDLEDSLTCCRILINSMDDQVSNLDWTTVNTLDIGSRIRVVFENKTSKDFQKYIKRQTSALTLLLTACNCKTVFEQKRLLEQPKTRQVFGHMKDDSSSLIVLHDAASGFTACTNSTGSSSKMSRMFFFDTELLTSVVYQRAVRALFKPSHRRDKNANLNSPRSMLISRPHELEMFGWEPLEQIRISPWKNKKQIANVTKVSPHGIANTGKGTIFEHIRSVPEDHSWEELEVYRTKIIMVVVDATRIFLEWYVDVIGLKLEDVEKALQQSHRGFEPNSELTSTIATLWKASKLVKTFEACEDKPAIYFLDHIGKITAPDYRGFLPNSADVMRKPANYEGGHAHGYLMANISGLDVCMFDVDAAFGSEHFRDFTKFVLNVNLLSFDQVSDTNVTNESSLLELRRLSNQDLKTALNKDPNVCIILIFHNTELLKAKLGVRSLQRVFPDYDGGSGVPCVKDYIVSLSYDHYAYSNRVHMIFDDYTPSVMAGIVSAIGGFFLLQSLMNN